MPITGFDQLDRFEHRFGVRIPSELRTSVSAHEGDEAAVGQAGIDWAIKQCRQLLDAGAPGIHFYTLNKSISTLKICLDLGITGTGQSG
jgi:methylenetetrahydrofolate reductase (NADPH)